MKKKTILFILLFIILISSFILFVYMDIDIRGDKRSLTDLNMIKRDWKIFSGGKKAKIIYSVPPHMYILDLSKGINKKIKGITTEGGPGRLNRGKTPRPFWNSEGSRFVYRYKSKIYISDVKGNKRLIHNNFMDTSKETRCSFTSYNGKEWLFGPSVKMTGILVDPQNPLNYIEIFHLPEIDKHCEMTADGNYLVYDNGKDIFLKDRDSLGSGYKISTGQSCRPCASPGKYVGWLGAPHNKYFLYNTYSKKFFKYLFAPPGEEIYRLNWSNKENYAVHMFGSRGNTKMTVRNILTGKSLFVGYGWDPDLWIGDHP